MALVKVAPGPGNVELRERDEREPDEREVLLSVRAAGVCGTDLHIEAGEYASSPPVTLGHEICGVVERVGPDADPTWTGRRVVCETFFSTCQRCQWCRDGRPNLCRERRSLGTHVDGGFAPRVIVPERNLHEVPDWLDDASASLAEPLACVCQAMLDPRAIAPGERVVVIGPGPIGLLAAQVARALGGEVEVRGLSSDAGRLAVAAALGFEVSTASASEPSVDVAIETSGSAGGTEACLRALRPGGRFVQIGIAGKPVSVPLDLILLRELQVSTGFASTPRSWRRALALIERRDIELTSLVSETVPLSDWERAFSTLRASGALKIVLVPR
jgi:L-iditol 2-dehydrogenase